MADNFYEVERAKTGRASCKDKDCKQNIAQGELRIAKNCKNPFAEGEFKKDWYHAACAFSMMTRMRAGTKKVESVDDLGGFEELDKDDQATIKDLIKGGGKAKKPAAKKAAGKKRKADSDDDDDDDDEPKKKKAKAAPKKKAKKGSDDDDDEEEEKPKKKKAAPKKKAKGSDDDEGSDDDKPKKKKAAAKKGGGGGGDVAHYEMDEKFWEISKDGSEVTVRFGKIGSNGQTKTKDYGDDDKAQKEYDKLVREKTKKGYELQD